MARMISRQVAHKFDLKGRTEAVLNADSDGMVVWQPGVHPQADTVKRKIYLPVVDESKLTDDDILKMRMYETHERRHLKYTSPEIRTIEELKKYERDPIRIWNALEDVRIDIYREPTREGEIVIIKQGREWYRDQNDQDHTLHNWTMDPIGGACQLLIARFEKYKESKAIPPESYKLVEMLGPLYKELEEFFENVRTGRYDKRNNAKYIIEVSWKVFDLWVGYMIKKEVEQCTTVLRFFEEVGQVEIHCDIKDLVKAITKILIERLKKNIKRDIGEIEPWDFDDTPKEFA